MTSPVPTPPDPYTPPIPAPGTPVVPPMEPARPSNPYAPLAPAPSPVPADPMLPPAVVPEPADFPVAAADLPLRTSRNIQGNVLAAFNKDHQGFRLVALPGDIAQARAWLAAMLPQIAVTQDVEDWNAGFSAARGPDRVDDPDKHVVWVSVSLTPAGIQSLTADPQIDAQLAAAVPGLVDGPVARAGPLGDIGPSEPSTWLFGKPDQPVHAIVTVAADRTGELDERMTALDLLDRAHGVTEMYTQLGETLPGSLRGHEHFGFKDGISQPGVDGFHQPGPDGTRAGHPGTQLVAAGEFVFGHPTEAGPSLPVPTWLVDGSVHVLRRLAQDVPAWRNQLSELAATLPSTTADRLGTLLMGRDHEGTPLAAATDPGPAGNVFDYSDDPTGLTTPCPAHIRKTNPRSFFQDPPRRLMRRGIPFGPLVETDLNAERGLVFVCFNTSLERQFEFIQQQWANSPDFAGGTSGPAGPDPVIGPGGTVKLAVTSGPTGTVTVKPTVTTTGSVYALALSLPTLRTLAAGGPLPQ